MPESPTDRRFYRIFKNRRQTVQYAVLRTSLGYAVTRWRAADDTIEPVALFAFENHEGTMACRNVASAFAERKAKEER